MPSIREMRRAKYEKTLEEDLSEVPESVLYDMINAVEPHLIRVEAVERAQEVERFRKYEQEPVEFINKVLGDHLWSKQREIAMSVQQNRFTAVPSCHGVGKSAIAARIAAWWISCNEPGDAFVVTSAPTFHQVRGILWREINRVHRKGFLPGHCNQTEWHLANELVGFGRKPDDEDMTAFQGIHALKVLVVLDEACGVAWRLWDATDTLVTNDESRVLAIGNPDDPASHFATVCKAGSGWNVIPISVFDSPNMTGELIPTRLAKLLTSSGWVEERRRKWGEKSPLWVAKVLGQFPDMSDDVLIPISLLTRAQNRDPDDFSVPNRLGVDVARFGNDGTVIYHRRGYTFRRHSRSEKEDTVKTTGRVINALNQTGATDVMIDDTGLGGGVTDQLKQAKKDGKISANIVPVTFGARPYVSRSREKANEKFYNLKTQIYWDLRDMLRDDPVSIQDDDALSQLGSMKYTYTAEGYLKLESKDDYKERTGLPSPDEGDALVLAAVDPAMMKSSLIRKMGTMPKGFSIYRR